MAKPEKTETTTGAGHVTASRGETTYCLQRRKDNTWALVTIKVRGDTVTSRRENEPDSLASQLGRLRDVITRGL